MITVDELAKIPLFSTLGESELKYLASAVEDMRVLPGEYTDHEGGARALFAIVSGKVELTKVVNGVETVIAIRLPGELAGEVPMTLSTPLPASMRAVEPSRVIKLDAKVFHTLAAMAPQISATVAAAALERMEMLKKAASQPPVPQILLIGRAGMARCMPLRAFCIVTKFHSRAWSRGTRRWRHASENRQPWPDPIRWRNCPTARDSSRRQCAPLPPCADCRSRLAGPTTT
jgi:hypothetical protein